MSRGGGGSGNAAGALPGLEVLGRSPPLTVPPFVQSHVTFIPSWIKWNYSGFEAEGDVVELRDLYARLRATSASRGWSTSTPRPRGVGTVRAFENLPLFSGRSTLEGLYMQGSPTAPFVFYLQSEVSTAPSCPFPDWGCARSTWSAASVTSA